MKKRWFIYLIALLSTTLFVVLQFIDPATIREKVEGRTFDLRLAVKNYFRPQPASSDIVIVTIDEKSLHEIGRWPWKRDIMAGLIRRISGDKPKVIGIDIMFSERENASSDGELAGSIREAGNVVLATAFIVPEVKKEKPAPADIPDFLWDSAFMEVKTVEGIPWKQWSVRAENAIPPIDEVSRAATLGHVYTLTDMDGVLRWEILYISYGDDCYPSFPLQIARLAAGVDQKNTILYGGSGVQFGSRFIRTDLSGRVLIHYRGKEYSYPYIPAADVINGRTGKGFFRDKIVFIGTSALGTYDQKVTPLSANMPGVEKNATVAENILNNNFLRKSPGIAEIIFIIISGSIMGLLIPRLKALPSAAVAIGFISGYVVLSCYLLIDENLWINLIYPVLNMSVIFISQTITRFFVEEKKAHDIRKMFSNYVSPKIVDVLISHPEKANLGGSRKEVTILFSDIIGFTSLSEKLPPEEVVHMLNEYFEEMVNIIFKWDGTLDKFVGDEIMAFWGAPADQPDHAERAVRCALDMIDGLSGLQKKWALEGKDIIDCGIGINTGEVLIGNVGAAGKKMDYTLIGDNVNLAARVEKLTRKYKVRIIVTEFTINHLEGTGDVQLRELDTVKVKGKENEVRIFEVKI
jgi:adenylate cyclase